MPVLDLTFASGESSLSVRRFSVHEALSSLFTVSVWARTDDASLDLASLVGYPASFRIASGYVNAELGGGRLWNGMVSFIEQVQAEASDNGLSTYYLRLVPSLWMLTQRRNYRIFQHLSIPDIADALLGEWNIVYAWKIDRGGYPKLEYKVQYGESDYAFLSRLCEEAGIAFAFPDDEQDGSKLTLGDKLHLNPPRSAPPIRYVDNPNQASEKEYVTHVRLAHEIRPGAHTIRDNDFRNPAFPLFGEAPKANSPEDRYEQYHYEPGAFLVETGKGGATPVADDRGIARHDQRSGKDRAERALLGERMGRQGVSFDTNVVDLRPGAVFAIDQHPHPDLDAGKKLLVTELSLEGSHDGEWSMAGHAVFTDVSYQPPLRTPKPQVLSVQSATVVGPSGQEIHTDEFGRVRVQFPWDREGQLDEKSSCWMRVNQGWGGAGYGMLMLPRIGQEVLIGFLEGNPDQPILVGRVFNQTNPVPYKLPENKTISTWKSNSSQGSDGFNEVKFEDKKADELVYIQAEKNLRQLVKHDETITVLNNREKHVALNETDTTGVNRTEVTGVNRTDTTGANHLTVLGGKRTKLIKNDESERTEGSRKLRAAKNLDVVVKKRKRERVEGDVHLHVKGERREKIDLKQSLTVVEDQQEHVEGSYALAAGKQIHLIAGEEMVGEAVADVTLKGPGGFIRIDASGITIKGTLVEINTGGGKAGKGKGSKPELPEKSGDSDNPPYEPERWNKDPIQTSTNCYAYAANDPDGHPQGKPQPGDRSGARYTDTDAKSVGDAAVRDGMIRAPSPPPARPGYYVVALVIDPGVDYHWYRQDDNGNWSHKPGSGPVRDVDASGNKITNPETADRNSGSFNYSVFGGYFYVPADGIKTGPP